MKQCFSVFGSFVTVTITTLMLAVVFGVSDMFFVFMLIISSWFMVGKLMTAMIFMQGSGLFAALDGPKKDTLNYWVLKIFKMPARCVIVLSAVLVPTAVLVWLAFSSSFDGINSNVRLLAMVAVCSEAVVYTHLFYNWRNYFFGSEYDARMEFKRKGWSPERIEESVARLRQLGIFGTP